MGMESFVQVVRHLSSIAKPLSPEHLSCLEPMLYLSKGAKVMLWPVAGTVIDCIYQDNQRPQELPIAIVVHFDNYTGPPLSQYLPSCVPICPITTTCSTVT